MTDEMEVAPAVRIGAYLDEHGVEHEVIEHEESMTARSEARKAHFSESSTAKAVLLADSDEYVLAVVPASERLDLAKVAGLIGRPDLRLATEREMAVVAPDLEVGALPIIGPDVPDVELVDRGLLEHDRILCSGGDHRHSISFPPGALLELMEPLVADLCEA